jgi:DNA-binding transcriptional ArsR family regulator
MAKETLDPDLLSALSHPLRISIMREAGEPFSPKQLSDRWGGEVSLQLIAYHVRLLAEAGLLKLESTRPRRGAVEHFYKAAPKASKRLLDASKALDGLANGLGK